jgi:4-alpha-glucanotransferase
MERSSGVLMPMSSLPSPYGIGTMGKSAYEFIDFLRPRDSAGGSSCPWA